VDDFVAATKIFFAPAVRKATKRAGVENRLAASNQKRTLAAETKRELFLKVAAKLIDDRPQLQRASRNRLAQRTQAALAAQGVKVSARTIRRALAPKK
jgi:NADH dehydrogenase FAD-containing subunit